METEFLDHYNRELSYLRDLGGEFAASHPDVAAGLGLDEHDCSDPMVSRLLEGFAFLAARVHRRLDSEFPRLTDGLLQSVLPIVTRPVPAATIVCLSPDRDDQSLAAGFNVARGTGLIGPTVPRVPTACRFETTMDVTLLPLRIAEAELIDRSGRSSGAFPELLRDDSIRSCLRLTLETTGGLPISSLQLDKLTVYLRGELGQPLLEAILARTVRLAAGGESGWNSLPAESMRHVGFRSDETLLPEDARTMSGHRLLAEAFLLPEKFQFVEFSGLAAVASQTGGTTLELALGLDRHPAELEGQIHAERFSLHCTPAINLFERRFDRVEVSDDRTEHPIVVDRGQPLGYEVWSIEQLIGHTGAVHTGGGLAGEVPIEPLYGPPRGRGGAEEPPRQSAAGYTTERRPRRASVAQARDGHRSPYLGTEVFVTLTDPPGRRVRSDIEQLSGVVRCTNRDLPMIRPAGGWRSALKLEGHAPVEAVVCLMDPTPPRPPVARGDGAAAWRLIESLTPRYLSIFGDQNGADAARRIGQLLQLHCRDDSPAANRIGGAIQRIEATAVTRQLPHAGPIVYARGVGIDLEIDPADLAGVGPFLLGAVLEVFFARGVGLNGLTQTTLRTAGGGIVHTWPVRTGELPSL